MKKAVGFRNISVDEYQSIDWQIVYMIVTEHLGDFKEFGQQVYAWKHTPLVAVQFVQGDVSDCALLDAVFC